MFSYRAGSKRARRSYAKLRRLYEMEVGTVQKVELSKAELEAEISRYKVKYDTALEAVRAARRE